MSIRHGTAESISQWSGHAVVPFIAKYRFPICHSLHTGQWTNRLMIVGDHNLLIFVISALRRGSHSTRQMDHWSNIGLFRWQLCYWVCLSHWHLGNSALNGSRWCPPPSTKHTQRSQEAKITQQRTVLRYNSNMYLCVWPFFPPFYVELFSQRYTFQDTKSHTSLCVGAESVLDMVLHHIISFIFSMCCLKLTEKLSFSLKVFLEVLASSFAGCLE